MITTENYSKLSAIQKDWFWSIGPTVVSEFHCSIWERQNWSDRGRVVIQASGTTFDAAVELAIKKLESEIRTRRLADTRNRFRSLR